MKNIIFFIKILILFLLSSNLFFAQKADSTEILNYQIESIEVTANRFSSNLEDSPTKIELISPNKVNLSFGTRLGDVLNSASNVHIKSYGSTPALKTISMNGLGAEHTLILIDGVKLNSFQNSQIDLSLIPKEIIERIEIISNGSTSLYGSEALGGVVNIITKSPSQSTDEKKWNIGAELSFGSYSDKKYSFNVSNRLENFSSNIFYSQNNGDGDFEYYYDNGIEKVKKNRANAEYKLRDIGGNFVYVIDSNSKLQYFATYVYQDKNIPSIETGNDPPNTNQLDRNWNNIISYEHLINSSADIKISLNFQNNMMNYKTPPLTDSYYKNLVYATTVQYNYYGSFYKFNAAYDFSYASLTSDEVEDKPKRNQHAISIASQIDFPFQIKILPSIRFETISDLDTSLVTGRLGLNFQPLLNYGFYIKGNMGVNYRSPSFNDLYWRVSGNKDLKSENSKNAEIGFSWYPHSALSGYIDFAFTYIDFKNKIVWTPNRSGYWSPKNIAESISRIYSISLNYNFNVFNNLKIESDIGAVFNDSRKTNENFPNDPTYNKQLIYIPENTFKATFIANYRLFNMGIFYSYSDVSYSDLQNLRPIDPYHILNLTLSYDLKFSLFESVLKFEVNNLTNSDYQVISGYPMPLRNYRLSIKINY